MQNEVAVIEAHPVQRVQDFGALTDSTSFGQLQRAAQLFSASKLVPEIYRGNVADCFVACEMAVRLGISPLMLMQGMAPVYGKPAMEGKLVTALINTSGLFVDSLDYEIVGDNPKASDYKVRAFATRKKTGKTLYGPWVDWSIVKGEGWDTRKDRNGNLCTKWVSIPSLMFMYRAAAFFGRTHCPERLMGMQTADEIQDVIVDQAPSHAALDALNAEVRTCLPETTTASDQEQKPPKQTKQTRKPKSQEASSDPVPTDPEPLPIQPEENASYAKPDVPSGQELKDMVSKWPGPDQERFRDSYKKSISEGVTPEQARADAWEHVGKDVQAIYESQNPEG